MKFLNTTKLDGCSPGFNAGSPDAHLQEDMMCWELIQAIADDKCENPQECCEEALKARKIKYDKWYE